MEKRRNSLATWIYSPVLVSHSPRSLACRSLPEYVDLRLVRNLVERALTGTVDLEDGGGEGEGESEGEGEGEEASQ